MLVRALIVCILVIFCTAFDYPPIDADGKLDIFIDISEFDSVINSFPAHYLTTDLKKLYM